MKIDRLLKASLITVVIGISGAAVADDCRPAFGGSEHSVGVPGPVVEMARSAFNESNEVQGRIALLKRHGYCPTFSEVKVELKGRQCAGYNEGSCTENYLVSQNFKLRRLAPTKVVSGEYTVESEGGARFQAKELNLTGLGRKIDVAAAAADHLMNGLSNAGVIDPSGLMGSMTLFVGKIECSQAVVPQPIPSCLLINYDATLELDQDASEVAMKILLNAQAHIGPRNVVGAVNVGASLLKCNRGVYPGAKATCTMVVERR